MNTQKIYELSERMTEQQANDIVAGWKLKSESVIISERRRAIEQIRLFESLVRLGDSIQLACSTALMSKPIDKETKEFYRIVYES